MSGALKAAAIAPAAPQPTRVRTSSRRNPTNLPSREQRGAELRIGCLEPYRGAEPAGEQCHKRPDPSCRRPTSGRRRARSPRSRRQPRVGASAAAKSAARPTRRPPSTGISSTRAGPRSIVAQMPHPRDPEGEPPQPGQQQVDQDHAETCRPARTQREMSRNKSLSRNRHSARRISAAAVPASSSSSGLCYLGDLESSVFGCTDCRRSP